MNMTVILMTSLMVHLKKLKKPFIEVFRVDSTELGQQVIPLMKTKKND